MVAAQMLLAAVFGTCDSQSTPATNLARCECYHCSMTLSGIHRTRKLETGDPEIYCGAHLLDAQAGFVQTPVKLHACLPQSHLQHVRSENQHNAMHSRCIPPRCRLAGFPPRPPSVCSGELRGGCLWARVCSRYGWWHILESSTMRCTSRCSPPQFWVGWAPYRRASSVCSGELHGVGCL
jgi:hypothetical protein